MSSTPREFRLLCSALRRPQRREDIDAQRQILAETASRAFNWQAVIDGARRHRVAPLVLEALRATDRVVPETAMAALQRLANAAARRSLAQIGELERLATLFADAGIRMIALKGVTLSAQLEGDGSLRGARDLDLLVDPSRFVEVEALLVRNGYRSTGAALSPRQEAAHRNWTKDVEFLNPATGVPVELHHRLTDNQHLLDCDFDTLWREREIVAIGGTAIATLPRRYLALYLCVHGAGHAWERLRWLADLAAALREPGAVEQAAAAASAAGLLPPMLHALLLAHDWLGLAVPAGVLAEARTNRAVARLDRILAHLYAAETWHRMPRRGTFRARMRYSLWQRLYRLSLKSDTRFRLRQALREFISPTDWTTVPLPDPLFFLYPLVRPVGWLLRRHRHG
ncbi:MAG TPA: nucleotidyltransferase family protein [Stellaceae bacterium]|nr:nucleotidyltransferase family protein [Stellaceae bacterium]